jgi:ABC-type transporter Mla subunit MlaD
MTPEERILRLENAFSTLVELARTQSERMDEYERRTEDFHRWMEDLQRRMEGIAELQEQTGSNLSALTEIVADLGRAHQRTEEKLAQTNEQLSALAATVNRYIESKGGRE